MHIVWMPLLKWYSILTQEVQFSSSEDACLIHSVNYKFWSYIMH